MTTDSHCHLPSKFERELLQTLLRLYDSYIYNAALSLSRRSELDAKLQKALNEVYANVMRLCEKYGEWCQLMLKTREVYLERNLKLLFGDMAAIQEVIENARLQESAKRAVADPTLVRFPDLDRGAFKRWRSHLRKCGLDTQVRSKTSFRRQRTV